MARRIRIDPGKLIQRVRDGSVEPAILEKFGVSVDRPETADSTEALKKTGKPPANRLVKIGKRGSIAIPKQLVAELGLRVGDTFHVRPSSAGLSLKKISD